MSPTIMPRLVLHERYRIRECVGQGGGGAVYLADDLRLAGRLTAVKEIRPDPAASPAMQAEAQEQFRREASILARLDHPALPKVSDYFIDDGADFLVMDFVAGPDLRQVVDERRAQGGFLEEPMVLGWVLQLLDVLDYLHGLDPPVLHRDIKPANIKRVEGNRLKLVDFGLVKPLDPSDPRTLTVARGVGSLPYTPLEQYAGDTGFTDVRSDLYAVGATMYHLLTGQPPATAQERFLLPNALGRPSQLNPDVSAHMEAVILASMALHPDRRPDSAESLREMLTGERALPPETATERSAPANAWRQGMSENVALVAIIGLLLLLAVLATWQSERARSSVEEAPLIGSEVAPVTVTAPAAFPSANVPR